MATVQLTATEQDVEVAWGVDVTLGATLTEDGEARDISLDKVVLTVRTGQAVAGEVLFTITKDAGQHEDPTAGKTRFALTAANLSENLSRSKTHVLAYAVRSLGPDGKQRAHLAGEITVKPDAGELVPA